MNSLDITLQSASLNLSTPQYAEEHHLHQLTKAEYVFWTFFLVLIAVVAIFGNLLVIYVISTSRILNNVSTNYFIVSLALADCLTGLLVMPFKIQAALLQYWPFPPFMCSLVPFVEPSCLSIHLFTLLAIVVDLFITHVLQLRNNISKVAAILIVLSIWVISIACCIPFALEHQLHQISVDSSGNTINICFPIHTDTTWWIVYNVYLTIIQYFVLVGIILVVYCIIYFKVWFIQSNTITDEREEMIEGERKQVSYCLLHLTVSKIQ